MNKGAVDVALKFLGRDYGIPEDLLDTWVSFVKNNPDVKIRTLGNRFIEDLRDQSLKSMESMLP